MQRIFFFEIGSGVNRRLFPAHKPGGGGGGALPGKQSRVYRCVIKKKTMRKGTFFQEGQCAALTSLRVGKMSFLWKKGMFFTILLKRCEKGWTEASLADMFWAEMTKMSKT